MCVHVEFESESCDVGSQIHVETRGALGWIDVSRGI